MLKVNSGIFKPRPYFWHEIRFSNFWMFRKYGMNMRQHIHIFQIQIELLSHL